MCFLRFVVPLAASGSAAKATPVEEFWKWFEENESTLFHFDDSKQTYTAIAFLLLDQALGEYDVETRVGQILVKPIQQAPVNASPLAALPAIFDKLFLRN